MSDKMREEFEQFVIRRDGSVWVTVLGEQRSYNEPIERDFEVWQASRAALVVELPGACDCCHDQSAIEMNEACAQAIEAVGVKVKA